MEFPGWLSGRKAQDETNGQHYEALGQSLTMLKDNMGLTTIIKVIVVTTEAA
jgi:hypothetical protein